MLGYLLTFIFCISIAAVVHKAIKKSNKPIVSFWFLVMAFVLKILAGCLYGFYYSHVLFEADTWKYFNLSLVEYDWLLQNPTAFIKDLFTNGYTTAQHNTFFATSNSFWKDLSNNILVKLLACMQLVAQRNYYNTVVLFSCITIAAPIYLWKLLTEFTAEKNKWLLCIVFLWPPILFFTSGIHKDGLLFASIVACVYYFVKAIQQRHFWYFLWAFVLLTIAFLLRSFTAITLLPFLACYYLYRQYRFTKQQYVWLCISLFVAGLCISVWLPTSFNILHILSNRRSSFLLLKGASLIDSFSLQATIQSFANYFFTAIKNGFLEPHLLNAKGIMGIVAACNNVLLVVLLVYLFVVQQKKAITIQPLWLLLLPFCLVNYIIIGYTVPFSGAIVRYKAMFEFLLLVFCIQRLLSYSANKRLYS